MPRIADVLEHESRTVDLEQGDFERLLGRRDRKQRNRRIRAGALGVIVALAMGIVLVRSLTSGGIPADPRPTPTPTRPDRGEPFSDLKPAWPQTSLEEVRKAQELADAGDPRFDWQQDPNLEIQTGQNHPIDAEIFTRFLEEKLGWEDFRWDEAFAHPDGLDSGDVVYIRCAPGVANPMYPDDPEGGCAPTIDELRYETVKIHVAQLARQGSGGIWVVTGWEEIEPAEQVAPPSEAELTAFLEGFLQARIDGQGAGRFADVAEYDEFADVRVDKEIPLLYATSAGAPYERSEFEIVHGPVWPEGQMQVRVRLFAGDGRTVVEQVFTLERDRTGRLRLVYDFQPSRPDGRAILATTENGKAVPVEYGFLDGEVTFRATYPLEPNLEGFNDPDQLAIEGLLPDDDAPRRILVFLADPRPIGPGCGRGPAPADAEALARSIRSDPDFEATAQVAVTIGGRSALQIDGVAAFATSCGVRLYPAGGTRARVYLLDLPGGSEARVLAIAIVTDGDSFDTVLEWAVPIVDSIEFHSP
jgi:hypothetical protein